MSDFQTMQPFEQKYDAYLVTNLCLKIILLALNPPSILVFFLQ